MCFYLYGSLYGNVSEPEYKTVLDQYDYKIALGTKHDVKKAVEAAFERVQSDYRITDGVCDCNSPVGKHDPDDPVITDLSKMITELAALPGAEQINICKTWTGRRNKKEIRLKLKETDLPAFLADMQENTLYCLING